MTVNSVLSTGVDGVRKGLETAQNAAQNIASQTLATADVSDATTTDVPNPLPVQQPQDADNLNSLTESLVDLKVAENQVKASAEVIKTADDMLGTLVDTRA